MSRQGALAKNTLILSFGTVVPKFVSVVTLPILTGFLAKADYGTYDLVTSMVTLLLPVATLQMQAAAFRFLIEARDDRDRQNAVVTNIVVVSGLLSIIVLAVVFVLIANLDIVVRGLICAYYLLDILVATMRQIARGVSKNIVYSVSVLANSIAEGLGIIGFVMLLQSGLNGALIASVIGQAVSLLVLIIGIKALSFIDLKTLSASVAKELISYSWPLIPNSLSSWAISMSDRLILTAMLGIEASAIYAAAMKIPNMLGIFQSAFTLAWQENASLASEDGDREAYYTNVFDVVFRLAAGGLGLLIAASPLFFEILIQGDYADSYVHMNILFLGALASAMSGFLGGIYIAHMRTKEIGATTLAVAVVNILVEILLMPYFGIFAASFAYTLSFVVLAVYRAVRIQVIQPMSFDVRVIVLSALTLIAMVLLGARRETAAMLLDVIVGALLFLVLNRGLLKRFCSKLFGGSR